MFMKLTDDVKGCHCGGSPKTALPMTPNFMPKKRGRPPKLPTHSNTSLTSFDEKERLKMQSHFWSLGRRTPKPKNSVEKMMHWLKNPQSKGGRTAGISNGRIYQMGIWPMAVVSSLVGLISNIQTANEIMNEKPIPPEIYKAQNGQYYAVGNSSHYSSSEQRARRYEITANRMQPFLRIKADPNQSAISFGAPWFF